MKSNSLILLLFISFFIYSCNTPVNDAIPRNEESEIIQDIDQQWKILADGICELDAHKIFSVFSKSKETRYMRNGAIYSSINEAKKSYEDNFKEMVENGIEQSITFHSVTHNVISENAAILTCIGSITRENNGEISPEPWLIGYTVFWIREEGTWRILNMHISWK